jgi:hypothetical protein
MHVFRFVDRLRKKKYPVLSEQFCLPGWLWYFDNQHLEDCVDPRHVGWPGSTGTMKIVSSPFYPT